MRRLSIKMERDFLTHFNFENTQNKKFSSVWSVILPKTLIPLKKIKVNCNYVFFSSGQFIIKQRN